jgi:hypothetical protein
MMFIGAGGSKPKRDAVAVGIGAVRRQLEFPADGQGLGVDLEHVDIVRTEAGFLSSFCSIHRNQLVGGCVGLTNKEPQHFA